MGVKLNSHFICHLFSVKNSTIPSMAIFLFCLPCLALFGSLQKMASSNLCEIVAVRFFDSYLIRDD